MDAVFHPGQIHMGCTAVGVRDCKRCAAGERFWSCCGALVGSARAARGCEAVERGRVRTELPSCDCGWGENTRPAIEGRWVSNRHGLLSIRQSGGTFAVVCPNAGWSPTSGTVSVGGAVRVLDTLAVVVPPTRAGRGGRSTGTLMTFALSDSTTAESAADRAAPASTPAGAPRQQQYHPHHDDDRDVVKAAETLARSASGAPQPSIVVSPLSEQHLGVSGENAALCSSGRAFSWLSKMSDPAPTPSISYDSPLVEGGDTGNTADALAASLDRMVPLPPSADPRVTIAVSPPSATTLGWTSIHTMNTAGGTPDADAPPLSVFNSKGSAAGAGVGGMEEEEEEERVVPVDWDTLRDALGIETPHNSPTYTPGSVGSAGRQDLGNALVYDGCELGNIADTALSCAASYDKTEPLVPAAEEQVAAGRDVGTTAAVAAAAEVHLRELLADLAHGVAAQSMTSGAEALTGAWWVAARARTHSASTLSSRGLGGGSGFGFIAPFLAEGGGVPPTAAQAAQRFASRDDLGGTARTVESADGSDACSEAPRHRLPLVIVEQIDYVVRHFALQPSVLRTVLSGYIRGYEGLDRQPAPPSVEALVGSYTSWLATRGVVEPAQPAIRFQDGEVWSWVAPLDKAAEQVRDVLCEFFAKNGEPEQLGEVDVLVGAFSADTDGLYSRLMDVYDGDRKAVGLLERLFERFDMWWFCTRCHHVLNSKMFNNCVSCGSEMRSASRPYFIPPREQGLPRRLPSFCTTSSRRSMFSATTSLLSPQYMSRSAASDPPSSPKRAYVCGTSQEAEAQRAYVTKQRARQNKMDRAAHETRALLAMGFVYNQGEEAAKKATEDDHRQHERIVFSPPATCRSTNSSALDKDAVPTYELRSPRMKAADRRQASVSTLASTMHALPEVQGGTNEDGTHTASPQRFAKGDMVVCSLRGVPHRGEVLEVDGDASYMVRLPNGAVMTIDGAELEDPASRATNHAPKLHFPPWHALHQAPDPPSARV